MSKVLNDQFGQSSKRNKVCSDYPFRIFTIGSLWFRKKKHFVMMEPLTKVINTSKTMDHLINYEHLMNKKQAEEIKQITDLNVSIVSNIKYVYKKLMNVIERLKRLWWYFMIWSQKILAVTDNQIIYFWYNTEYILCIY